jgi:hypothetical protein
MPNFLFTFNISYVLCKSYSFSVTSGLRREGDSCSVPRVLLSGSAFTFHAFGGPIGHERRDRRAQFSDKLRRKFIRNVANIHMGVKSGASRVRAVAQDIIVTDTVCNRDARWQLREVVNRKVDMIEHVSQLDALDFSDVWFHGSFDVRVHVSCAYGDLRALGLRLAVSARWC